MTSNIGSQLIQEETDWTRLGENNADLQRLKLAVLDLLRKTMRPEFLNRIDEPIMFSPLDEIQLKEIVKLQLHLLNKKLQAKGLSLLYSDDAVEFLAKEGFDPQFGARPVKRIVQKFVLNELSKRILTGEVEKEKKIYIDSFGEELIIRNE